MTAPVAHRCYLGDLAGTWERVDRPDEVRVRLSFGGKQAVGYGPELGDALECARRNMLEALAE